jgi:hypothetical protein
VPNPWTIFRGVRSLECTVPDGHLRRINDIIDTGQDGPDALHDPRARKLRDGVIRRAWAHPEALTEHVDDKTPAPDAAP